MTPHFVTVTNTTLSFDNKPLFLSGANQAWVEYGNDFGESSSSSCQLQDYVTSISGAGGNSIRVWLYTEGDSLPSFSSSGLTTPLSDKVVFDLQNYLSYAAEFNVFVTLTLVNGALMRNQNIKDLFTHEDKLQSFIDNAVSPLISALSEYPSLLAYEIINEPEGSILSGEKNENPCFNTTGLANSGAGWAGTGLKMEDILRFTNKISFYPCR